ncbi:MAG TPA: enoyl-CoA hydratase-related protein [Actinomycetota bacterium]|nr:enoyl-CoA hydratase-related protein [Actinomycetota bacterium]
MDFKTLVYDQDGPVATVTLNRPERKNAMSWAMFEEIGTAFELAAGDDSVRCVVLTGAGDAFCSGADLGDPDNMVPGPFRLQDRMRRVNRTVSAVVTCPKPVVARVAGIAAGAGCNLALGCDLVAASTQAAFAELFVKRGLVVDFGGSWALTRALPLHRAKELALLGDTISAARAYELGLLNRLCEPNRLDGVVGELADKLVNLPPRAVSMIKSNLNRATERSFEETLEAETAAQALCFASRDTYAAMAAFMEKRPPRFTGS